MTEPTIYKTARQVGHWLATLALVFAVWAIVPPADTTARGQAQLALDTANDAQESADRAQQSADDALDELLGQPSAGMMPASSATVSVHAGCVIRGDGGWHIHENATHYCGAVRSVHVETDGDLVLELNSAAYGAVAVEDQGPGTDETFSRFAECGASGGLGTTTIRCWDRAGRRLSVRDPRFDTPLGNFWFWVNWRAPAAPAPTP